MSEIHSILSGDGTVCVVIDGKHYTAGISHPRYGAIRKQIRDDITDDAQLIKLMNISDAITDLCEGKVRISLDEGKVWYDDTEFHDQAFCDRVLRLMNEGHDTDYLVNFLNNLGKNPEFRAIMETFKFICNEGMPITPDGCFLGYKGVANDYFDKYSGTMDNTPDGRRMEYDRSKVCSDSSQSCAQGLHVGSYRYAKNWGDRVVLVKVNPKDVVSVPNHECEKMRVCGYWVIKDMSVGNGNDKDRQISPVLKGEVYDSTGQRVPGQQYAQFDNEVSSHWDDEDGRAYGDDDTVRDDEVEEDNDFCWDCDMPYDGCVCNEYCPHCDAHKDDCECEGDV